MKKLILPIVTTVLPLCLLTTSDASLTITPSAGHILTWDGNDGDFAGPVPTSAPDNAALASNGGVPFAENDPGQFPVPHVVSNLNDGFYGNSSSHINGVAGGTPGFFMGVMLPNPIQINTIAFGRNNTSEFLDRSVGSYTLQYTTTSGAAWIDIGGLVYTDDGDNAPGGTFDEYLRHEYDVSTNAGPIVGDGVRIVFSDAAIAIDEIEINPIPEPSGVALLGLGLAGLLMRRKR